MRGDRVGHAAARRIGRDENRGVVVIDLGDEAIGRRTWIAGKRAALEHMAHMIGEAGIDSAPNHVSADYGNLGVPDIELGENFLREIHHPVEIAVAAGHAAAAEDDRTADLLPASTMWEKSAFTASRSKYSVPVPR